MRVASSTTEPITAFDGRSDSLRWTSVRSTFSTSNSISDKQPQAGVAGADVVGGEADPGAAEGGHARSRTVEVVQRLVLGELDDQPLGRELVAGEDARGARRC